MHCLLSSPSLPANPWLSLHGVMQILKLGTEYLEWSEAEHICLRTVLIPRLVQADLAKSQPASVLALSSDEKHAAGTWRWERTWSGVKPSAWPG